MADQHTRRDQPWDIFRVHDELVRIEQHWTDQIQSQQQRQATVLAANGLLLGFLGGSVTGNGAAAHGDHRRWLVAALIALSAALVFGAVALLPRWVLRPFSRPTELDYWLNSQKVWEDFSTCADGHPQGLWKVCDSLAHNQNGNVEHERVRLVRVRLMVGQLVLIATAAVLLIIWLHWLL